MLPFTKMLSVSQKFCTTLMILFFFLARSYYRCTNPRCNAKKQVERSMDDPETLIVTYEGLHLHYTYPHIFLSRTQDYSAADLHVSKKPKIQSMSMQTHVADCPVTESTAWSSSIMEQQQLQPWVCGGQSPQGGLLEEVVQCPVREDTSQQGFLDDLMQSPQGLLEDVVPLLVRKPSNSTPSSYDPRSSSTASSPSYSSLSWTPIYSYLDVGILSSII